MSDFAEVAGRLWRDVKDDVSGALDAFGDSLTSEARDEAELLAKLAFEVSLAKMHGENTAVAEKAMKSTFYSLQSVTVQGAALAAAKAAEIAMRRILNTGLALLVSL